MFVRTAFVWIVVLWAVTAAAEVPGSEMKLAREFVGSHFATGPQTVLPFSFVYEGRPSAELLREWNSESTERRLDDQRSERTLILTDPKTRLVVRCAATQYQDFPAVEWVLSFKNAGTADTPILENVQALDTSMGGKGDSPIFSDAKIGTVPGTGGQCRVHYAKGSHARITDFQPLEKTLTVGDRLSLGSFGGRSSDGFLPFFNLALPGDGGVVTAIGWTGQWAAEFSRTSDSAVHVQAGMERTHLTLHPGEEIRTPAILLMFWSGSDRMGSQNLFRKLLLRHYTPTPGGKPVDPPVAFSPHGQIAFEATNETNLLELIGRIGAEKLPVDYWWIDAGWYDCDKNWALWVGNWQLDPKRFPRGLKPVADAVHQDRMKFLLWFEPERVMRNTWIQKNHPDWLFAPPPAESLPAKLRYMANDGFYLLNLGNSAALAWAKETFGRMIRELGIDAYRNDFNMYPVYYWRHDEAPDRQGINEIRYVTGLYDYFDTLVRQHPGLLLDTCASGGRRIDFEMLRRCLVLTRSDYLWDPVGQQCHTFGLAQWVPLTGIGAASSGSYECRSGMGAQFVVATNMAASGPVQWKELKTFLEQYRAIRHLFQGDFYPLSPYSIDQKAWLAYQFDRPDLDEGIVQVFRRKDCAEDAWTGQLGGVDPQATYVLTSWDDTEPQTRTGQELREKGLTIRVKDKPGAGVVVYRKTK